VEVGTAGKELLMMGTVSCRGVGMVSAALVEPGLSEVADMGQWTKGTADHSNDMASAGRVDVGQPETAEEKYLMSIVDRGVGEL
jgi:hypothetical protein